MESKINKSSPNSNSSANNQAPPDPSNTNNIGQRVEQGIVGIKEGISEQSSEWEDKQERTIPSNSELTKGENYLKRPSPEEKGSE